MKKRIVSTMFAAITATSMLAVPAVADTDIKQGGELSLITKLVDAHVRNFNPYNNAVGTYFAKDFIYESLWIANVMHPEKPIPVLATSYTISDDLKSVTFKLREGVKWSDGETFNADDVVFTARLKKKHPEYDIQGITWFNEDTAEGDIIGVEKLNDYEVRFDMKKPNALTYLGLGAVYPLPEHIWKDIEDPNNYRNENPVATGPFVKVEKFSPSMVKICRNDAYWQENKPYIDCLKFPQFSSNEQAIAAASLGEVDWLGIGISSVKHFKDRSEHNQLWLPPGSSTNLHVNNTKKPFNDLPFRQAMSMAINRDDLVNFATFGLTTKTKYPIGTGEFYKSWYNEDRLEKYKYLMDYNPEGAQALLDKAGYVDTDGDGFRENPDGSELKFKISVPSGWTDWVNSVMQVSENLKDIGVNAIAHTPDENAWFDAVPRGDFDVYIMWTNLYAVPWKTYNQMLQPNDMIAPAITFQAMHQMPIPEAKAALERFARTTDKAEQRRELDIVHEQVAQNMPVIPLFANPEWYQYSTRQFTGWSNEENPFVRPMVHGGIPERWAHVLNLRLKD